MNFYWIQYQWAGAWNMPQKWSRFGWTWNYIKIPFTSRTLLIIHGWGTIERAKFWLMDG